MIRKTIFAVLLLLTAFFSADAQNTAAAAGPTATDETSVRRAAFDKVWTTINEKHYDPTFGGVDWRKMREVYEPRALAAKTDAEFNAVLNQMLGELRLSHFAVFSPPAEIDAAPSANGTVGIELKMIDGLPVVSRFLKDSAAQADGLKTGFVIEKIDDKTIAELLAPLEKSFSGRTVPEAQKNLYRESFLVSRLDGSVAPQAVSRVKVEVRDADDKLQAFEITRIERKSEMSPAIGNFPPQEVVFESRRLANGIGYIRFNIWVIPQMAKIRAAIREFADAPGIVFDLRGNPGGVGGMASGIAGLLFKEQTSLGTMKGRDSETKFIVYPQANAFAGKVVIITDNGSGSTSEVFAAGMQETGRAKIVGERSAGMILLSVFEKLPTGALFQYAISDYKSPKSVLIEGRGVEPDAEIKQTRAALLEGRDLQLEEAVRQISGSN